ncbi:3117_t:CDS:2 [Rhizophagus irregularis]|nr:3117_t:CDS:2 [Rhizophagus irregularis]
MSSHSSSHILKKNIVKFFGFSGEQIIRQFKLNHGIILSGKNIRPSIRSIIAEDGENLKMSLYKGQPLVYTINSNNDKPLDMCINFPIAEIIYSGKAKSSLISDSDVEMIINDNATSGFEKFCNEIINEFEEQQNNIRKEIIDEFDKFRSENLKFLRLSNVS